MSTADDLRTIYKLADPLIDRWLDLVDELADVRTLATSKGIDWGQVKALIKAKKQDERDGGDGSRVERIVEKADFASAYADMLGFTSAKMNERNSISRSTAPTPPVPSRPSAGAPASPSAAPVRAAEHEGVPGFLDRRRVVA